MRFTITYTNASGVAAHFIRRTEADAAKLAALLMRQGYRVAVRNEHGLVDLQGNRAAL